MYIVCSNLCSKGFVWISFTDTCLKLPYFYKFGTKNSINYV